jgi:hypothetical protein
VLFCFGTSLIRFADQIGLVVPIFTFVLVVPSFTWSEVWFGGIFGEAFLLRGFGILGCIWPTHGLMVLFATNVSRMLFMMGLGWYL